jgi:hypothetical protein
LNQFLESWLKFDDGEPRVERIFFINVHPAIRERYDAAKMRFGADTTVRRFHGTSQVHYSAIHFV